MLPHVSMIVAIVLWSTIYVAGKTAVTLIPLAETIAWRFLIAAGVLWLIVAWRRESWHARTIGMPAFIGGFFEPGVAGLLTFWGLTLTSAISATVLFSIFPLVSTLMGRIFLKEEISPLVVMGSLIAVAGTLLLIWDDAGRGDSSLTGDAIVVAAMLFIVTVQLRLRRLATIHGKPLIVTSWQMTGAAACGFVFIPILQGSDGIAVWMSTGNIDPWIVLIYMAVFVSALTFQVYNYALRYIPVGRISLYYTLVAPLGVPFAAVTLGETVSTFDLLATLFVVIGVALPALPAWRAHRNKPAV
ncbi:MAG: DMT family transporter [Proteobacteria bacterium]|nr:DMT family transporter [Pseudomonadota bacterium]